MAAATMYVTPAGAGTKDGLTWANAFGYAEWETDWEGSSEAGDIYYVAGGTYTLTSALTNASNGTAVAPIQVIGVKSGTTNEGANIVLSDYAFGDDRPLIVGGANYYLYCQGTYHIIQNLRGTGSGSYIFLISGYSKGINLKGTNSGSGFGLYMNESYGAYINCEASSSSSNAIDINSGRVGSVINCYAHDSVIGIDSAASFCCFIGNVVDTCTTGIKMGGDQSNTIIGNTIYNCTTGILGTTNFYLVSLNNIIDACTTGATWTTEQVINYWDYNCWNNTSDTSNVTKGLNAVTADPTMTDPGNGDFTLQAGSPALDTGIDAGTNTGATT